MQLKIHFCITLKILIVLWNCIFKLLLALFSKDFFSLLFLSESFPSNENFIWSSKNMLLCPPFLFWITSPSWLVFCFVFFSLLIWKQGWKFYEMWKLWKVKTCVASSLSVNKNEAFFPRCFCLWRLTYTELVSFFTEQTHKKSVSRYFSVWEASKMQQQIYLLCWRYFCYDVDSQPISRRTRCPRGPHISCCILHD